MKEKILNVCNQFNIDGELVDIKRIVEGHINSAFYTEFDNNGEISKYLVQNVNIHVFKDQDALMGNIISVTDHLKKKIVEAGGDPIRETLHFIKAKDGSYVYREGENCWRIYVYVDDVRTYNKIDNPETFEKAAKGFGNFQMLLDDFDGSQLKETIPNFHNTPKRIRALEKSADIDINGRVKEVTEEIKFVLDRKEEAGRALKLLDEGKIPLRVTHNDTKINNILFDKATDEALCVIDLDTIMPGLSLYDFGDAIRTGAATAAEDEPDYSLCGINLELFESYVKGYLSTCGHVLTDDEINNLAYGAKLMTFECGVRFLTDYLDGDVYFRIGYKKHNLVRARNQFAMVEEIEKHFDEMNQIVHSLANR